MEADDEDTTLLAQAVAGSHVAFDTLVDRYAARIYAICWRYFGNNEEAEDAAQGALLALYRGMAGFRAQSAFSTWMYRVTTNACHDLARRNARHPRTVPLDDERSSAGAEPLDDAALDRLVATELQSDLRAALAQLDAEQRHAVVLRDVVGAGYDDIARLQGVAVGTAKSRVHRGHARLAELLEPTRKNVRNQTGSNRPPTMQD
jgi:RNA polymerase sigma-70 factor (ECF subfamily)